MASVVVVAHRPAPGEDHPRVTISGLTGTVVLDITSPETEFGSLADQLSELERPFERPILVRQARQLATMALEATIGSELRRGPRNVEPDVLALIGMARTVGRTPAPVRIAYSHLDRLIPFTGRWAISDLRVTVRARLPGSNLASRVDVSLQLTEESPAPTYSAVVPGSPSLPASPPPAAPARGPGPAPAGGGGQRRHTVRKGETLSEIASAHYGGNASKWREIAKANNVRDPRRLAIGTVLVLP